MTALHPVDRVSTPAEVAEVVALPLSPAPRCEWSRTAPPCPPTSMSAHWTRAGPDGSPQPWVCLPFSRVA